MLKVGMEASVMSGKRRFAIAVAAVVVLLLAVATVSSAQSCVVPARLGVALSLDDSSSMSSSDPDGLRGVAAGIGLDALPDGSIAAASTFSDAATAVFAPTRLDGGSRPALKSAIANALVASGNTDYDQAFSTAGAQLNAMAGADKRALIFLSDGEPNDAYTADQPIGAAGIPIYAIGFGSAPPDELSSIAQRSGGAPFAIANVGEAQSVFDRIIAQLTCDSGAVTTDVDLQPGEQRDYPFAISAADGEFRTLASWASQAGARAWLTRPDGTTVTADALKPGEALHDEPTYSSADVQYPTPGAWALHVQAAAANFGSVHVAINVFRRTGSVPDLQTFYSHDVEQATIATPTPSLFQIPLGLALVPSLDVAGRISPNQPAPAIDVSTSSASVTWYGGRFNLSDMTWHPGNGQYASLGGSAFAGNRIGYDLAAGIALEAPTIEGDALKTHVAFPFANVKATAVSVKVQPRGAPMAQLDLQLAARLKAQLFVTQGGVYVGEKIAEGLIGAAATVLSDGVGAPVVIEVMNAQLGYEIGMLGLRAQQMAGDARKDWNLLVNTGLPLMQIFRQAIAAGAPRLVPAVAKALAKQLPVPVVLIAKGNVIVVRGVYQGGRWVVKRGGKIIAGGGHVLAKGYHFVRGVFSLSRAQILAGSFEARPIAALRLGRLRSAQGLGFGPMLLSRSRALASGRALVKYGLSNMTVRPLLVSTTAPKPGRTLRVAGGHLNAGNAVVELSGPGYRGQKLVRISHGVAGASLRLPKTMRPGTWTVGILDYSTAHQRRGVLVDAYRFTVKKHKTKH